MKYALAQKYGTYSRVAAKLLEAKLFKKRMPVMVELQVNKECNLRCTYCYAQLETLAHQASLTLAQIKAIIDELHGMGMRVMRILGGEPLLRKDIGEIIRYLRDRNVFIELSTNCTLLKALSRQIHELALLDVLQVSIDGNEAATDAVRGSGTYARIIEGIEAGLEAGLPIRLHGVYNKFSIEASPESPVAHLARLSEKYRVPFNFCQYVSSIDGKKDAAYIEHSQIMGRGFYAESLQYKKKGYRFFNSFDALEQIMHWPDERREFLFEADTIPAGFNRCRGGQLYCFIDSDGSMYPCVPLWKKGLNINEVGIKKAWEFLEAVRHKAQCFSCVSMGDIEFSKTMSLNPKVLWNTFRQVFLIRKK
ncbi:MAG TPA: radical SAM protein [Patescibacteria group bacterium]|nr:radical SAM protein [Patescibacteria group bacterium]